LIIFLSLLWALPASIGLVSAVRDLLPWELPDSLVPLFIVLCCLLCMVLPVVVDLALAMSVLVGLFYTRILRVKLTGREPFVYPHIPRPSWWLPARQVTITYQAEHISGDIAELAEKEEEPEVDPPAPRSRKYIPDL
jgi:hypothetical protein